MALFRLVLTLGVGMTLASQLAAQERIPSSERFPAELDAYIAMVLADGRIPGIAIGVVRNDSVLVAKGYGVRELGKPDPVNEHTIFDIASLAKSFTSTAAAILVDRGLLRWDDPVRRHLPHLVLPTPALTDSATVRDFLSHRTGLEPANMMWVLTAVDRAEVLRRMQHVQVVAPFRDRIVYSNIGYTVAGEALAAAASTSFEALLRDLLIKPLGLCSTTWSYAQTAGMPNVAASHATIAGKQEPIRRERQRQAIAPAAAVQSSVHDLTRWMRLHLNRGVLDGHRFVSDSAIRELHTIHARIPTTPAMRAARMVQGPGGGYGLGWQIMDYRGHPIVWHTGNGDGQIAYMALLPRERLGVIVLVNTWSAPLIHWALLSRILDSYLSYEPRDWAGETLARVPALERAQDSARIAMEAMRSVTPPPLSLELYAGRYEHPVFGPLVVEAVNGALTLQMGDGETADLEYHGGDAFFTRWRDPFFREVYGTHAVLPSSGGRVDSLRIRLNRDEFTAVRRNTAQNGEGKGMRDWRQSWPGTDMAVVSGQPLEPGPFVFRFRMPDGYWICPHTHPNSPRIRVISGTFLVGTGSILDPTAVRRIDLGGETTLEQGMTHFEGTHGPTEIEVRGTGPWGITFLDPRSDPASGGGCRVQIPPGSSAAVSLTSVPRLPASTTLTRVFAFPTAH